MELHKWQLQVQIKHYPVLNYTTMLNYTTVFKVLYRSGWGSYIVDRHIKNCLVTIVACNYGDMWTDWNMISARHDMADSGSASSPHLFASACILCSCTSSGVTSSEGRLDGHFDNNQTSSCNLETWCVKRRRERWEEREMGGERVRGLLAVKNWQHGLRNVACAW